MSVDRFPLGKCGAILSKMRPLFGKMGGDFIDVRFNFGGRGTEMGVQNRKRRFFSLSVWRAMIPPLNSKQAYFDMFKRPARA